MSSDSRCSRSSWGSPAIGRIGFAFPRGDTEPQFRRVRVGARSSSKDTSIACTNAARSGTKSGSVTAAPRTRGPLPAYAAHAHVCSQVS
jgi:hypothetical protein